ncbi:winged helix-turn-helix domain-containing protein [Plantactinospora sp. BB1]|uniref:GntR family transcriptional regulator n=1 Tax=Plantactinospora sp. BB1 TaxID=2071627 RepID=UPI000D1697F5|nr:winged helix-turn-helix domain-containing protein [Plantactinospora sp. BB1]AVT39276.1 GntR family transcriptional regulator [Plantactinospora sp. BB1]
MPAKPKWERIADEIRGKIESGELASGAQLPSTAQLRAEYGVSAGVVRQAILVLQTQGLVEGVHGVGVFVSES